ncbi:MAG TPA: hypothetical protein VGO60_08340 [Iamia sp.]|jgi:hypothetical protein|nr:hypothetical protein [Iamia sp.]
MRAAALCVTLALVVTACSSSGGDDDAATTTTGATSDAASTTDPGFVCPTEVDAEQFSTAEELRDLLAELTAFGLRSPGSDQHEASIDWLADQLAAVPGMEIDFDEYTIDRWQPTPEAAGAAPGRDLAAAGGLTVDDGTTLEDIAVAGAVPFSLPTPDDGAAGQLAFLAADDITPATAAGKVVVTEIPHSSLPYAVFEGIGHYLTDDLPTEGDYDRPYTRDLDGILTDAGTAGAAGLVMVWDAPTEQLEGYWDPHTGTRFRVPAVFVGQDDVDHLRDLAAAGATAHVTVRAEWDEAPTRNLVATLPGRTRERIVVNANTDGVDWVQENATVAAIALARYLGGLPVECRQRDVQIALTTDHLGFTADGTFRYGPQLDEGFDEGTVAFVMAPEHLGAREILPTGPDGRLELTGENDLFAWSAPDESPVLVEASIDAVERRGLDRTAVIKGAGAPVAGQVPTVCSQGGLGTNFHGLLIPTIAGISGPWSLWAPSFGEDAIDFERMRAQTLAFGDIAIELDDVDRIEIAGAYVDAREQRAAGVATCDLTPPPAEAPAP